MTCGRRVIRAEPNTTVAELSDRLIDCEEDRTLRAVLVGVLRETGRLDVGNRRDGAFRRKRHSAGHDPIQPPPIGDALQLVLAGVFEHEPRAGDEISYGLRDENFGGSGLAAMRDPVVTVMPPGLPSISSHSPVWTPARISMSRSRTS